MSKKISELTAIGADVVATSLMEVSQGGASYKAMVSEVVGAILAVLRANSGSADISGVTLTLGTAALGTPSSGILSNCKGLTTTVKITAANYTAGTTDATECYGGVIFVTSAATITLPAVVAGMSLVVATIGAIAVSVDPNASDLIIRDGTAQADGEKITNLSTAGDIAVLYAYDSTGWYASTNAWTNGG